MRLYKFAAVTGLFALVFIAGCSTTPTTQDPKDPWEGWNRDVQSFNDHLDDYVMKPVAKGYRWIMPGFADRAVTNFFSNIDDIGVTFNDLLQGKVGQSGADGARFLVNTTAGIGGLIDVGAMIDLPKHNEDFGQTLGVWGLSTGPYMVLPFFGPSSPRGVGGLIGDAAMNPISYVGGYISTGLFALNATDLRADNLAMERIADEAALDRYIFFRDAYLARRKYLVYDGNPPDEEDVLDLDDDYDSDGLAPVSPY